jgi:hypothetical protein
MYDEAKQLFAIEDCFLLERSCECDMTVFYFLVIMVVFTLVHRAASRITVYKETGSHSIALRCPIVYILPFTH